MNIPVNLSLKIDTESIHTLTQTYIHTKTCKEWWIFEIIAEFYACAGVLIVLLKNGILYIYPSSL